MTGLQLIVGLGNPSPDYDHTRHNVGAQWVRALADRLGIELKPETRFKGHLGRGTVAGQDVRLLVPTTYMNNSGEAVGAVTRFFKLATDRVLVAYDEMAFEPGIVRLKFGGGDNGHNGIKSVRAACGNDPGFHRLRIGVGHPGDKSRVTAYLTQIKMPAAERECVTRAGEFDNQTLDAIMSGDWQAAMNALHATPGGPADPAPGSTP